VVLCPDGTGRYRVGEVLGDYYHVAEGPLPHRRAVHWLDQSIDKTAMQDPLRHAVGAAGTISNVSQYGEEIRQLTAISAGPAIVANDPTIEDPATFALEKHLEDFLVQNWAQTELGKNYVIFEEEGEKVGQQYPTDTGPSTSSRSARTRRNSSSSN
jgi:restriction system protein